MINRVMTLVCVSLMYLILTPAAFAQFVLETQPKITGEWQVNYNDLCQVAQHTQDYINRYPDDEFAVHAGDNIIQGLDLARVKQTLAFVCQMASSGKHLDVSYLREHFDFYRWLPDKMQADKLASESSNQVKQRLLRNIPSDQIFLTKYYAKLLDASKHKTEHFDQALYQLPNDEQGMTLIQAEQQKSDLTRFKFTRQQIINGAIEQGQLASPLVWLTEDALHDVLLQGTGVVDINGQRRYFNVHRNNGIAYDYTIGKTEQARYWYFAEVPSILGYGQSLESKIPIIENVSFAGNVRQLGLGKLLLVNYEISATDGNEKKVVNHLGVLADQGGAFDNNLFQLDFLRGSYRGWQDYYQANKHLPDYASAWLLLVK